MKIEPQSFKILPELEDPIQQIGTRSRICYKSEDKGSENEYPFVAGIIKKGHNSCLEMATLSIEVPYDSSKHLQIYESPYLHISYYKSKTIVTGTIRAWREYFLINKTTTDKMVMQELKRHSDYLLFFEDIPGTEILKSSNFIKIIPNTKQYLHNAPVNIKKRHIWAAVKFITNRAVSHEKVRHRPVTILQESQRYCRYSMDRFGNEVTFILPNAFFEKNTAEFAVWEASCKRAEIDYFKLLETKSPQAARLVLPNSCKTEIIMYCNLRQWEHIFALRAVNKVAEPSMRQSMIPVMNWFINEFPDCFNTLKPKIGEW